MNHIVSRLLSRSSVALRRKFVPAAMKTLPGLFRPCQVVFRVFSVYVAASQRGDSDVTFQEL
jgi:hypothetical protein